MNKLKLLFRIVTLLFWTITLPTVLGLYLWTCKREELYSVGVILIIAVFAIWLGYYVSLLIEGLREMQK